MTRWNIEKIVEEPLKAGVQGKLFFGKSTEMESIKIVAKLEKTEELKREIRESPEFKKCMVEVGHQEVLTPVCSIVRHHAAALDKIHLIGNIETEQVIPGTEGTLIVE